MKGWTNIRAMTREEEHNKANTATAEQNESLQKALDAFDLPQSDKEQLLAKFLQQIQNRQLLNAQKDNDDKKWENLPQFIRAAVDEIHEFTAAEKEKVCAPIIAHLQKDKQPRFRLTAAFLDFDGKVTEFVDRFAAEGLTRERFLRAIINTPRLLIGSPEHCEENIRDVATKFADEGLTAEAYLKAALIRPSLFKRAPDTIVNNIQHFINLDQQGYLNIKLYSKPSRSETFRGPHADMFAMLMSNPKLLTDSIDNIDIHVALGLLTKRKINVSLFHESKVRTTEILADYVNSLDHPLKDFIPASDLPNETPKTTIAANSIQYGEMLLVDLAKRGVLDPELNANVLSKIEQGGQTR